MKGYQILLPNGGYFILNFYVWLCIFVEKSLPFVHKANASLANVMINQNVTNSIFEKMVVMVPVHEVENIHNVH